MKDIFFNHIYFIFSVGYFIFGIVFIYLTYIMIEQNDLIIKLLKELLRK